MHARISRSTDSTPSTALAPTTSSPSATSAQPSSPPPRHSTPSADEKRGTLRFFFFPTKERCKRSSVALERDPSNVIAELRSAWVSRFCSRCQGGWFWVCEGSVRSSEETGALSDRFRREQSEAGLRRLRALAPATDPTHPTGRKHQTPYHSIMQPTYIERLDQSHSGTTPAAGDGPCAGRPIRRGAQPSDTTTTLITPWQLNPRSPSWAPRGLYA